MKKITLFLAVLFIATSAVSAVTDSNTLRYGETSQPDTFDPYTSTEMPSARLSELMFNGLVSINEKQEILADLAERWTIRNNVFTFYLRNNVFWHNKDAKKFPFTANDVAFTYNLISHKKTQSNKKNIFTKFKQVKVIDSHTVQITVKKQFSGNLSFFQFKILPEHQLKNSKFLTKRNPFSNNPIGTGPYKFLRSNHNREVTLIANKSYYAGNAKIEKIVSKPFADKNIMTQALNFNALDIIVNVSPRNIAEIQANRNFTLVAYNTLSYSFFAYNNKNIHLAKKKVRKALSLAINREEMIQAFFNGQGQIISGPFAPGSWAYNLNIRPDSYDPQKAIHLLKEAGYHKTSTTLNDQQGKPLKFNLNVPISKNDEASKRVILAYKNYMKKIGVTINIRFMERQAWKKLIFNRHRFDITYASWSFDDSSDIRSLFHSSFQKPGQNNFVLYTNNEVDKLLDLSQQTQDYQEKRTINQKLHKILADESPYAFLWSLNNYTAYSKKLKNVAIHPFKFFNRIEQWEKH